jgi:hypothetical protein
MVSGGMPRLEPNLRAEVKLLLSPETQRRLRPSLRI